MTIWMQDTGLTCPVHHQNLQNRNMKHTTSMGLTALLGATAFISTASAANVIVNSGFDDDSGNGSTATNRTETISGWGSTRMYTHAYNGTQGPKLFEVGQLNYGVNDDILLGDTAVTDTFKGVDNSPSQTVDLTSALPGSVISTIDSGSAPFAFSAWMAGWSGDGNIVATRLQFFGSTDGSGSALGTFLLDSGTTTNFVTSAEFLVNGAGAGATTAETDPDYWRLFEIQTNVPVGARSATVDFVAGTGHVANGGNDWYVDNVVVDIVPEPSSSALVGLAGLGLLLRRRK